MMYGFSHNAECIHTQCGHGLRVLTQILPGHGLGASIINNNRSRGRVWAWGSGQDDDWMKIPGEDSCTDGDWVGLLHTFV